MRLLLPGWLMLASVSWWLPACQSASTSPPATAAAPAAMSPAFQTEKFNLSANPGCADGYPATIEEGHFTNSAGSGFPLPYGHFLTGNWTGSGVGWAVGDTLQAVPDSLELRWFSYTEDKFYEGHFLLPQQRIYDLLKQGFWNSSFNKYDTYTGFTATVLPTGGVVVWLTGLNRVLIGRYQAKEIYYNFANFIPQADRATVVRESQADLSPKVKHEIATGTISSKKWDDYLKTYAWKLEFSRPLTLTDFGINCHNGESIDYPPTPDRAAYARTVLFAPTRKAVPEDAMLYLAGDYGRKRLLKVDTLDEHETMSAFQNLAARHPKEVITLYVDIDEGLRNATLSLRAGGQVIPLTKSPIEFFDLP